jgi:hypothetical protein
MVFSLLTVVIEAVAGLPNGFNAAATVANTRGVGPCHFGHVVAVFALVVDQE